MNQLAGFVIVGVAMFAAGIICEYCGAAVHHGHHHHHQQHKSRRTRPHAGLRRLLVAVVALIAISAAGQPAEANASTSVVAAARSRIGKPYRWGAAGPNAFDCSGLVVWAYQQIGVALPHSSQALSQTGQYVDRDDLQPGDVVIFYPDATHAGIYTGDGMVVHASTSGRPVAEVPLDQAGVFHSGRRFPPGG